KGNPVLTSIKNVQWEYGDIVPDYVVGQTACVLYLSLKYHRLHPEYIYNRIKPLAHMYTLRILLVLVDIPPPPPPLTELTKTCLINNLTLILAFSPPEAARYLELYKSLEHTPPTLIREKQKADYASRMVDVVTKVRSVSKTDAVALVGTFGSVRGGVNARAEEVVLVQGWGERKAGRWREAVEGGFRVGRRGGGGSGSGVVRNVVSRDVAEKLGIGPAIVPEGAGGGRAGTVVGDEEGGVDVGFDDDEERALAEAEKEAERERVRAGGEGASSGGGDQSARDHDGIMKALEKLRA
ncbi:putative mating-type switch/DNA repair protein Swi10/Rad10, partial [Peziza echinospora]